MGADQALLEGCSGDGARPALRLYWWSRPTLSLGRFQAVEEIDLAACVQSGVDVVRRPTGGRAVLHDLELTYSVVASVRDGLPRGVEASYAVLCSALVLAYRRLGVPAELTSRPRGGRSSACYLHATRADLSLGTAKLSGSAQVWRGDVCLQHGSIVIARDCLTEARLMGLGEAEVDRLAEETVSLRDVLGREVTRREIAFQVESAFAEALGVTFRECGLTRREEARAVALGRRATVAGPESDLDVPLSLKLSRAVWARLGDLERRDDRVRPLG